VSNTTIKVDQDKLQRILIEQANEINHWCCKSEVVIGVVNGAVITICAYSRDEALNDGFVGVDSEFRCIGSVNYESD
jgi:hypothetical protein